MKHENNESENELVKKLDRSFTRMERVNLIAQFVFLLAVITCLVFVVIKLH